MSATFGEQLRRYRLAAGLTQAALAELANLSEQGISMLERGTRSRPRPETIDALIAALKLDTDAGASLRRAARRSKAKAAGRHQDVRSSSAVPWQLPPTVPDFTGREHELEKVLGALARADQVSTLLIISGMGGVGKTALALHAGHLAADLFPDGQLYVKLRGYDPGAALTSTEALAQLLRSLGVRPDAIPSGVDEMASLYRSKMAGRRMLVLLDDAKSVQQVRLLLPGDIGSATVITSRRFLASLPGGVGIRLSAFPEADSVRLLSKVAGEARIASDESAARQVSALTGGLPLALRLVGGRLAARPNWHLQHIIDQLQDEHRRLDELGLDHSGVRASFAGSLDELIASSDSVDREAAAIFDLLSLAEGTDISVPLIARLADRDEWTTEQRLERLVDLHLLDSIGPGRYRLHDLLRTYANERLSAESRATERTAAIERGMDFFISAAWRVQRVSHPWSPRRPMHDLDNTGVPEFSDMASALGWLDAEYDSILDLYRKAAMTPDLADRFGPTLALALFGYLESRANWDQMRQVYDLSIASANPEVDPSTSGWLEHDRAIPDVEQGHLDVACTRMLRSFGLFEKSSDKGGMARCASSLSHILERLNLLDEAIEWGERGLAVAQEIGDMAVVGTSHLALGVLYNRVDRSTDAEASFRISFELAEVTGTTRSLARRHRVVATSYIDVGQYDQAFEHLTTSLRLFEGEHDPVGVAEALQHLSTAQLAVGELTEAEQSAREGLRIAERYGDSHRQATILGVLATIHEATGNPTTAQSLRRQAIAIYEAEGMTTAANTLRGLLPDAGN